MRQPLPLRLGCVRRYVTSSTSTRSPKIQLVDVATFLPLSTPRKKIPAQKKRTLSPSHPSNRDSTSRTYVATSFPSPRQEKKIPTQKKTSLLRGCSSRSFRHLHRGQAQRPRQEKKTFHRRNGVHGPGKKKNRTATVYQFQVTGPNSSRAEKKDRYRLTPQAGSGKNPTKSLSFHSYQFNIKSTL